MNVHGVGAEQSRDELIEGAERRLVSQIELFVSMIGVVSLFAVLAVSLLLVRTDEDPDSFGAWFAFGLIAAMASTGAVLVHRASVNRRSGLAEAEELAGSLERMRSEGYHPPVASDVVARGVAVRHALLHSGDVDLADRLQRALAR